MAFTMFAPAKVKKYDGEAYYGEPNSPGFDEQGKVIGRWNNHFEASVWSEQFCTVFDVVLMRCVRNGIVASRIQVELRSGLRDRRTYGDFTKGNGYSPLIT